MGVLKLPQRLLSGRPLFPVRLHRIAQFRPGRFGRLRSTAIRRCGFPRPTRSRSDALGGVPRAAPADSRGDCAGGALAPVLISF